MDETSAITALLKWLRKEIDMMREILSNMHQEEVSLLKRDKEMWASLMQQRSELYLQLHDARDKRMEAASLVFPQGSDRSIEKALSSGDPACCDLCILRDQMIALIDRLNTQGCRNELLAKIAQQEQHQTSLQPQKKGKISIATIPPEEQ